MTSAAVGIVPVDVDDASAPLGCAALRELRGEPLLVWAVRALTTSAVVPLTLVAVPPALEVAVAGVLRAETAAGLEILPVPGTGSGPRIRATLEHARARAASDPDDIVVVHDPLYPLSPPALLRSVVEALATGDAAGSAPARPVTDTLKLVDGDDLVRGTAGREGFRMIYSPQAYRLGALTDALVRASDGALRMPAADTLLRLVLGRGGEVRLVPAPGDAFRVASQDDLLLGEALLQVGQGSR